MTPDPWPHFYNRFSFLCCCFLFCLSLFCVLCSALSVSLDCTFLTDPSDLSDRSVYFKHWLLISRHIQNFTMHIPFPLVFTRHLFNVFDNLILLTEKLRSVLFISQNSCLFSDTKYTLSLILLHSIQCDTLICAMCLQQWNFNCSICVNMCY